MDYSYYDRRINKKTIKRYDMTPLFLDHAVFANLVKDLTKPFKTARIDKVVGLDALGFIIAGAAASKMKVGLVPIRKGGKLPGARGTIVKTFFVDYTGKRKVFEMNKAGIRKGDRVLIIDEWIETGSQVKAAIRLIERQGGKVIGISVLHAEKRPSTNILFERYGCKAINLG